MLKDITIKNYRLFNQLKMDGFTHLNLLVGMNNSGKSSLLEAIYLLVKYQDPTAVMSVLHNRGIFIVKHEDSSDPMYQISEIFNGHTIVKNNNICIGSEQDEKISIKYCFFEKNDWPPGNKEKTKVGLSNNGKGIGIITSNEANSPLFGQYPLKEDFFIDGYVGKVSRQSNKHFVTTESIGYIAIHSLWNEVVLTAKEEMVLEALRILEPDLERIALMNYKTLEMGVRVKLAGKPKPIALGSLGNGIYRIFALVLSLVNAENGVLLVDEIDTGLHYTALTKMWQVIIKTAQKLNVQVFATTHSWDGLASFQKVINEKTDDTIGKVFRLQKNGEDISYVVYDKEELAVAVDHYSKCFAT